MVQHKNLPSYVIVIDFGFISFNDLTFFSAWHYFSIRMTHIHTYCSNHHSSQFRGHSHFCRSNTQYKMYFKFLNVINIRRMINCSNSNRVYMFAGTTIKNRFKSHKCSVCNHAISIYNDYYYYLHKLIYMYTSSV